MRISFHRINSISIGLHLYAASHSEWPDSYYRRYHLSVTFIKWELRVRFPKIDKQTIDWAGIDRIMTDGDNK